MPNPKKPPTTPIRPELLRSQEVMALTGIGSATQLLRLRKEGLFPPAVRIGKREIAWRRSDIDKWIAALPTA